MRAPTVSHLIHRGTWTRKVIFPNGANLNWHKVGVAIVPDSDRLPLAKIHRNTLRLLISCRAEFSVLLVDICEAYIHVGYK